MGKEFTKYQQVQEINTLTANEITDLIIHGCELNDKEKSSVAVYRIIYSDVTLLLIYLEENSQNTKSKAEIDRLKKAIIRETNILECDLNNILEGKINPGQLVHLNKKNAERKIKSLNKKREDFAERTISQQRLAFKKMIQSTEENIDDVLKAIDVTEKSLGDDEKTEQKLHFGT